MDPGQSLHQEEARKVVGIHNHQKMKEVPASNKCIIGLSRLFTRAQGKLHVWNTRYCSGIHQAQAVALGPYKLEYEGKQAPSVIIYIVGVFKTILFITG